MLLFVNRTPAKKHYPIRKLNEQKSKYINVDREHREISKNEKF